VQAFTANLDGGSVTIIDVATRTTLDEEFTVGSAPADVAFTPCAAPTPRPSHSPHVQRRPR